MLLATATSRARGRRGGCERLAEERLRRGKSLRAWSSDAEVVEAHRRSPCRRRGRAAALGERLEQERLGLVEAVWRAQHADRARHGLGDGEVRGPRARSCSSERRRQHQSARVEQPEVRVDVPQHDAQLRLHVRLAGEHGVDARGAAVEQRARGHVAGFSWAGRTDSRRRTRSPGIAATVSPCAPPPRRARAACARARRRPRAARAGRPPRRRRDAGDELARPVARAVGPREHRSARRKRRRSSSSAAARRVAARRLLAAAPSARWRRGRPRAAQRRRCRGLATRRERGRRRVDGAGSNVRSSAGSLAEARSRPARAEAWARRPVRSS